jgi:hypothetical protein
MYKHVGSLLPNVPALLSVFLRATLVAEAAKVEEGPSHRASRWVVLPLLWLPG